MQGLLVFADGFRKLVGAGSVVAALDACKQGFYFVNVFPFDKAGNPLQVATATTDKTDVAKFVFGVYFK